MGVSLRVLTLLQLFCGYLDLILDWDPWEQALCDWLQELVLRTSASVLPEQRVGETYVWPFSTAFTSGHPSSLSPPNPSPMQTHRGPRWLSFVNIIQPTVEIILPNPEKVDLPRDFSLFSSLPPSLPSSLLSFFFPFIIKHFNVYSAPATFPGTRIQWWELYFSLILQLSINLRTILNLKSDLTTFFLPSGSRASHHNPLACPVGWSASSAALKPSTGPASFVPLESRAGDKGTASYRKLEPPGRACFALQSSFLHFFSSAW